MQLRMIRLSHFRPCTVSQNDDSKVASYLPMILLLFTPLYRRNTLAFCQLTAARTCTRAIAVHIRACTRPIYDTCPE